MNSYFSVLARRLRNLGRSTTTEGTAAETSAAAAVAPYTAPLWLIAPPSSPAIDWTWQLPTLQAPVSQMCTSDQMEGDFYTAQCVAVGSQPHAHRKLWEFIYVKSVFDYYGVLRPDAKLLGFGVGREPLPSTFAARGAAVVATDAPEEMIAEMGWQSTNQHAANLDELHRWDLVERDIFDRLVSFEPVDMNAIPEHLRDFDGCWSACALEHLGSIDKGLEFIENSLATLKPGGIAVHTTEFNLSSNDETFDRDNLAIYRRKDLERLIERLVAAGHRVAPLNLHPGTSPVDEHIDLPPYALPHLKLDVFGYVVTSIGLVVVKDGLRQAVAAD